MLREAATQDFEAFYEREMRYRRALRYPPLTGMVELLVTDRDPHRAAEWAVLLAAALREESDGKMLLSGPGPAPIEYSIRPPIELQATSTPLPRPF